MALKCNCVTTACTCIYAVALTYLSNLAQQLAEFSDHHSLANQATIEFSRNLIP